MKRIISMILMFVICLSCAACSNNTKTKTDENGNVISKEKKEEVLPPDEEALNPPDPTDLNLRHYVIKKYDENENNIFSATFYNDSISVPALFYYNAVGSRFDDKNNKDSNGFVCDSAFFKVFDGDKCVKEYVYGAGQTTWIKEYKYDNETLINYKKYLQKYKDTIIPFFDWVPIQKEPVPNMEDWYLREEDIYNSDGKIIKEFLYVEEGLDTSYEYTYENGKKHKHKVVYYPGSGKIYSEDDTTIDLSKTSSSKDKSTDENIIHDEYDSKGRLIKDYNYDEVNTNGVISYAFHHVTEITYNDDDTIKEERISYSSEKLTPLINKYTYSKNKYLISKSCYLDNEENTKVSEYVYKYDKKGNQIEIRYFINQ